MAHLKRESVYNTYLLSDIQSHGFDKPYQQVYVNRTDNGDIQGVYLKHYNNLILDGDPLRIDVPFLVRLIGRDIDTVMGKASLVEPLAAAIPTASSYVSKGFYRLRLEDHLPPAHRQVETAGLSDVDEIHDFLMTIPSFEQIYSAKEMIETRIQNGDGTHMFIRDNSGRIVAHANSAAQTDDAAMIGGVAVSEEERGRGLGSAVTAALCRRILSGGRSPTLFSEVPPGQSLFPRLGFEQVGKWGVLQLAR